MLWRFYFCLPGFIALLALGTDWAGRIAIAGVGVALTALIFLGRLGKWPALVAMWLVWLIGGLVVATTLPFWPVMIGTLLAVWLVSFAAVRIGSDWGQARYARLAAKGRGIREWEWVFTGADYVRDHPLNRLSVGPWLSVLALVLCAGAVTVDLILGVIPLPAAILLAVFLLPIWPILARHPVAYPLVLAAFGAALLSQYLPLIALMTPVLVYWVDGVRPNLIYRHRFERMLPPRES